MNFIINPGSEIATEAKGWTNTHAQAKKNAYSWFYKPMLEEGFTDIEVTDTKEERDGRWLFIFKHTVTGKEVELEIHGIDDLKAYETQNIFTPRVYWNGGSSSNPELDQFAADGFKPVKTYTEVTDLKLKDLDTKARPSKSPKSSPKGKE
jgi:hypothetical protein